MTADFTNSPDRLSLRLSALEMLLLALRQTPAFTVQPVIVFLAFLLSGSCVSGRTPEKIRAERDTQLPPLNRGWSFFCFHLFLAIITPFITVGSGSLSGLNSGVLDSLLYLCVAAIKQAESTGRIKQSAFQQNPHKSLTVVHSFMSET